MGGRGGVVFVSTRRKCDIFGMMTFNLLVDDFQFTNFNDPSYILCEEVIITQNHGVLEDS